MTDIRSINIDDYDYLLPEARIASHPLPQRDSCKLLVRYPDGGMETHVFSGLPGILPEKAMLVYNNTRVINARMRFRKGDAGDGAQIEIFCLEPDLPSDYARNFESTESCSWLCFVGNSKRGKDGELGLSLDIDGVTVTVKALRLEKVGNASRVRFSWDNPSVTFSDIISAVGEIPIPPYLNRATEPEDEEDYQTVYSHIEGSVAAPTAGLHFTDAVLDGLDSAGILRREVTLHVGAGTFQPVKADNIGGHEMHSEFFAVGVSLIEELAEVSGLSVIAVGTTSVRTLESLYHAGCLVWSGQWDGTVPQWYPYSETHPGLSVSESMRALAGYLREAGRSVFVGSTRLLIAPGYKYRVVDGMVTNFHQPRSTLLLLVSAMIGDEWKRMYGYALENGYRFLSYGDACLLLGR